MNIFENCHTKLDILRGSLVNTLGIDPVSLFVPMFKKALLCVSVKGIVWERQYNKYNLLREVNDPNEFGIDPVNPFP